MTSGSWGAFRLDAATTTFHLEGGGELVLEVTGIRDMPSGVALSTSEIPSAPLSVDVEDGRLTAAYGFLRTIAFGDDVDGIRIVVGLHEWSWTTTTPPVAWLGLIEGARVERGNLTLQLLRGDQLHTANGGFVLDGASARWFLVPSPVQTRWSKSNENAVAVIVPADGSALEPTRVRRALRCLEFALGRHVHVETLVGVDDALMPVAAFGLEYGQRAERTRANRPTYAKSCPASTASRLAVECTRFCPATGARGGAATGARHIRHAVAASR